MQTINQLPNLSLTKTMFSLSFVGGIQNRKEAFTRDRTMGEFYSTHKKYNQQKSKKIMPVQEVPKASDFPSLVSSLPKDRYVDPVIDQAILEELEKGFLETEFIFSKMINFDQEPFEESEMGDIDAILDAEFESRAGWYQECPECWLNANLDAKPEEKCCCK